MAQSRADFKTKLYIALKEANETHYWIELFHDTNYIDDRQYKSLNLDVKEIIRILMAILKSIKLNDEKANCKL